MGLGPLMIDLAGTDLESEERELALHPAVGGVVLFKRNFESFEQLSTLTAELHGLRSPALVIAVDHEGGRVQRFRKGFTELPPAGSIGAGYGRDPGAAKSLAEAAGLVAATELRRAGIDVNFAPVVDLAAGNEEIIGERAFHSEPGAVGELAAAWLRGAARAGCIGVAKHFPGHGTARGDTHTGGVGDRRALDELRKADLHPFRALAPGPGAVMTGHLRFPGVDGGVVTFSRRWLRGVLRSELGFAGIVLSDDLTMAAAVEEVPAPEARVEAALGAGCDAALLLNDRAAVVWVLERWRSDRAPPTRDPGALRPVGPEAPVGREYRDAVERLTRMDAAPARAGRGRWD